MIHSSLFLLEVACWMVMGERQAARIRGLNLKTILRQDVAFFDMETNTREVVGRMSGDTVLSDLCEGWFGFFIFGYVLHVQDLCEWRERQMPLFDLLSLAFLCYFFFFWFLFWEERDIKLEQKYIFTLNFNRGGLRISNEGNHRWAKCQN